MTPLTNAVAELMLAIDTAEGRGVAALLRSANEVGSGQPLFAYGVLEDHRVEVAGDLADALDRIQAGLGARFMQAMFPESILNINDEEAAEEVRQHIAAADRKPPQADAPKRLQ